MSVVCMSEAARLKVSKIVLDMVKILCIFLSVINITSVIKKKVDFIVIFYFPLLMLHGKEETLFWRWFTFFSLNFSLESITFSMFHLLNIFSY